jgi:Tfp pilus assembly protein PilX
MVIPKPLPVEAGRAVPCAPPRWKTHIGLTGGAQGTARPTRQRGSLLVELLIALAIMAGVLLPLAYSFTSERRIARAYYNRAVAMEIVDGEMEVLLAGEARAYQPGTQDYTVHCGAATNLPPGRFSLTVQTNKIRLRWQPAVKDRGGPVTREAMLP